MKSPVTKETTKMISKSCKYAIRASVYIASKAGQEIKLGVKEIAAQIEAPEAFTAKILQILNKHQIVTSLKGPYGGFFCQPYQLQQSVLKIVHAVDGPAVFRECVMGLNQCSDDHPCPMHHRYAKTRDQILQSFQETTLGALARDYVSGSTYLKNLE